MTKARQCGKTSALYFMGQYNNILGEICRATVYLGMINDGVIEIADVQRPDITPCMIVNYLSGFFVYDGNYWYLTRVAIVGDGVQRSIFKLSTNLSRLYDIESRGIVAVCSRAVGKFLETDERIHRFSKKRVEKGLRTIDSILGVFTHEPTPFSQSILNDHGIDTTVEDNIDRIVDNIFNGGPNYFGTTRSSRLVPWARGSGTWNRPPHVP
jgi:hypothetical protein